MNRSNLISRRFFAITRPAPRFEGSVRIMPMPQLSPHMVSGKLLKWHYKEGDIIPAYELIADVRPDQLTEPTDKSHNEITDMEVELQEEMYVVKYLCKEGAEVKGGVPLALLCEMEEDIEQARALTVSMDANVYTDPESIPMALWQAYLKKKE